MFKLEIVDKNNIIFDGDKYYSPKIQFNGYLDDIIETTILYVVSGVRFSKSKKVDVYKDERYLGTCSIIKSEFGNFSFNLTFDFNYGSIFHNHKLNGCFVPIVWKPFFSKFSPEGVIAVGKREYDIVDHHIEKIEKLGLIVGSTKIGSPTIKAPDVFFSNETDSYCLITQKAIDFFRKVLKVI